MSRMRPYHRPLCLRHRLTPIVHYRFTYVAGWLYNIVLCFVMGDPQDVLASPLAQPVAQIFYNVLGKAGGMTFTVCAFVILKVSLHMGMFQLPEQVTTNATTMVSHRSVDN